MLTRTENSEAYKPTGLPIVIMHHTSHWHDTGIPWGVGPPTYNGLWKMV